MRMRRPERAPNCAENRHSPDQLRSSDADEPPAVNFPQRPITMRSFLHHSRPVGVNGEVVRFLIVLLAILGMIASSLALKVHYDDPGKEPCSINDKWDCGVVNHSPYAMIGPLPVAAIGIAGYLLIALLALLRRRELLV